MTERRRIAAVMRALGWEPAEFKRDKKTVKGFRLPENTSQQEPSVVETLQSLPINAQGTSEAAPPVADTGDQATPSQQ